MGCFDTEDGEEKCARLVQIFMGRLKTLFLEKSAVLKSCILMEVFSRMLRRVDGAGLIRGFKVEGRRDGGEIVSHLLFVDDTILFCDVDVEQILYIRLLLLSF